LWAHRPNLADWLTRIRARPSFDRAITEWLSAADRDRFDIPRAETWQKVQEILRAA
jgi:hypothetical protein